MRVKKAITSLIYYYENIFDLTDTPRPHFEKMDIDLIKSKTKRRVRMIWGY